MRALNLEKVAAHGHARTRGGADTRVTCDHAPRAAFLDNDNFVDLRRSMIGQYGYYLCDYASGKLINNFSNYKSDKKRTIINVIFLNFFS